MKDNWINSLINLRQILEEKEKNCANCINMQNEACQLATPPATPPVRVIVTGCKAHSLIPF